MQRSSFFGARSEIDSLSPRAVLARPMTKRAWRDCWPSTAILVAFWAVAVWAVNPVGEFTINDDWSFVRNLEAWRNEGRMIATGWGKGGPALLSHLLLGTIFTELLGPSLTALRLSVLTMGVVGSLGLLTLLLRMNAPPWLALAGAMTLAANPLYLSQSFTFMTDVTFASVAVLAILFLGLGVEKEALWIVALGLFLSLLATLTRQIGLVIPAGFLTAVLLHGAGRRLGRMRIFVVATGVVFLPWVGYETWLWQVGSTPVFRHEVLHAPLERLAQGGFPGFLGAMLTRLLLHALLYLGFFLSPLLILGAGQLWKSRAFRRGLGGLMAAFALLEIAHLSGFWDLPVILRGNILNEYGIGPILLKDVYILKLSRLPAIPKILFHASLYLAIVSSVSLVVWVVKFTRGLMGQEAEVRREKSGFVAVFTLASALAYLAIITVTGFHDRYLIPVIFLLIVWLVSLRQVLERPGLSWKLVSFLLVAGLAIFSVAGTSDFMSVKRAQKRAHDYLAQELGVMPCRMDGGFEFNGYHCDQPGFEPVEGLSWWWVTREDYLLTLGPLPGYRTVRTYPFRRTLGGDGSIHILQPGS